LHSQFIIIKCQISAEGRLFEHVQLNVVKAVYSETSEEGI